MTAIMMLQLVVAAAVTVSLAQEASYFLSHSFSIALVQLVHILVAQPPSLCLAMRSFTAAAYTGLIWSCSMPELLSL
jgi:hypothetical protein